MPVISIIPTFSPNFKSELFVPIKISRVIPSIAAAVMDEKIRIKKRYGCLRENMLLFVIRYLLLVNR
jgi:hypothetical protein